MSEVRDDTSREKMTKHGLLLMLLLGVAGMSSKGQVVPPQMLLQLATNAPVELKVTAVDGSEIDLSKLRGKVVLLDFWPHGAGAVPKGRADRFWRPTRSFTTEDLKSSASLWMRTGKAFWVLQRRGG